MNNLAKVIALGGRRLNRAMAMHYLFSEQGIPKDYVQDSLIMRLDGILNTRKGHNANATEWEDLVGPYGFTKTSAFSFGDNCILVTGQIDSKYGVIVPAEYTLEVIYQYNGNTNHGIGFVQNAPLLRGRQSQTSWWARQKSDSTTYRLYYDKKFEINAPHSIAITQSSDGARCYYNGTFKNRNSNVFSDGNYQKFRNYIETEVMTGKIFAIRLHKRALTDEELAQNYEVDKARFGLTATASVMMLDKEEEVSTLALEDEISTIPYDEATYTE